MSEAPHTGFSARDGREVLATLMRHEAKTNTY